MACVQIQLPSQSVLVGAFAARRGSPMRCAVAAALAIATMTASARADLVGDFVVGNGAKKSYLQFEFANSNAYLYEVRYDGSVRGIDLIAMVAAAQPGFFSYSTFSFPFGEVLFGVTIGSDADSGFGTPPLYLDYWHYWTREPGQGSWTNSMVGFGDRTASNGSWDGWVFGSDAAPMPVPAPAALAVVMGGAIMRSARRRRS